MACVIAIGAVSIVLRTIDLSGLPSGLNVDEAATGLDARKIFAGHGVWPYTSAALGQPAGPMYWSVLWVKLLGSNVFAVRLPMAIMGAATSVLGFFAFRELFGRPVAYAGAWLLAFSAWLIFFSRTGFTAVAMPFAETASLLAFAVALRKQTWPWFVLAGLVAGAGVYSYFSYPLFLVALAVFALVHAALERPAPGAIHARNLLIMGAVAVLSMMPMLPYVLSTGKGYRHDRSYFALSESQPYRAETSQLGKLSLYAHNARDVAVSLFVHGRRDASDGSGVTSALDPLFVGMFVVGTAICGRLAVQRRRAAYLWPAIAVPIILIGPILSVDGYQRRGLGILPFVAMPAAVALGECWLWIRSRRGMLPATLAVAVVLIAFASINVYRYFWQIEGSPALDDAFSPELTVTAEFMKSQPHDTHIYFLSNRWPARSETIRYLIPERTDGETNLDGTIEDRSGQFGSTRRGYDSVDRSQAALIVLMGTYLSQAPTVAGLFPDAEEVAGERVRGAPAFIAFKLPAR